MRNPRRLDFCTLRKDLPWCRGSPCACGLPSAGHQRTDRSTAMHMDHRWPRSGQRRRRVGDGAESGHASFSVIVESEEGRSEATITFQTADVNFADDEPLEPSTGSTPTGVRRRKASVARATKGAKKISKGEVGREARSYGQLLGPSTKSGDGSGDSQSKKSHRSWFRHGLHSVVQAARGSELCMRRRWSHSKEPRSNQETARKRQRYRQSLVLRK